MATWPSAAILGTVRQLRKRTRSARNPRNHPRRDRRRARPGGVRGDDLGQRPRGRRPPLAAVADASFVTTRLGTTVIEGARFACITRASNPAIVEKHVVHGRRTELASRIRRLVETHVVHGHTMSATAVISSRAGKTRGA